MVIKAHFEEPLDLYTGYLSSQIRANIQRLIVEYLLLCNDALEEG